MVVVFDDIIYRLQKSGGVSAYWFELTRRIDDREVLHVDFDANEANVFSRNLTLRADQFLSGSHLPVSVRRYLPVATRLATPHIFHSSYYRYSTNRLAINVTTVHDFIYERFQVGLPRCIHHIQKSAAVARSLAVVCVSHATAEDFRRYFPHYEGIVQVIPNGASEDYRPISGLKRKRQVLFVGDRSPYKNFDTVVEAIALLPDYRLVFVGGGNLNAGASTVLGRKLGGQFTHLSSVSNVELNLLYNESHCLVYPSSYEGFGIPLVEAMRAGCPVVAGNAPALVEVGGDAALYLQHPTAQEIAKRVRELENESRRELAIERGRLRGSKFSWDACASATRALYEKLLSQSSAIGARS